MMRVLLVLMLVVFQVLAVLPAGDRVLAGPSTVEGTGQTPVTGRGAGPAPVTDRGAGPAPVTGRGAGQAPVTGADGLVPGFPLEKSDLELARNARPGTYFDRAGRRCAILGSEGGTFEAWCYPLKLFRNFELSFLIRSSTTPIRARDIAAYVSVTPEAAALTYAYQSFTVRAVFVTPVREAGAFILLDVDTTEPLTIVCSFIPVLQPMWPAGLGGQNAHWDGGLGAYVISEPTRRNHGIVGSPAAEGISYTPAHMLSESPNQFKIAVADPGSVRGKFIPIVIAGGRGDRDRVEEVYRSMAADPERYYRENVQYFRTLRESTMRVRTPDERLNLAFEWAKVSLDNLFVENPDLGFGMVAGLGASGTGGRPGFGWYFGGDSFINSFSLNGYGAFGFTKKALAFNMKWQRDDGKMAHELSQAAAYIDWFGDYPYGYIHGDTTPYFIAAFYDYLKWSGDTGFLEESWPALEKAYEWCLSTDRDGDGLMDNDEAGLGALEYGSLTGIQTDVYLAAVWCRACYCMSRLAAAAGDVALSGKSEGDFKKARRAFDEKFWDSDTGQYVYAFSSRGDQVKEATPWSAAGLMWGFGRKDRSLLSLRRMISSGLGTDWGTRSLSVSSGLFEPLNYNYGAVWPFITGFVSAAAYRHNLPLQGYCTLMSTVQHTFNGALGHVNEVFSGYQHAWPMESVPHQGFCTGGLVLPFVRGMLGLEGDAVEGILRFEPKFNADWGAVYIENCRVGGESFDLTYRREKVRTVIIVTRGGGGPFKMVCAPLFGPGTKITAVSVNGKSAQFTERSDTEGVQPAAEFDLSSSDSLEIFFEPAVGIIPPRVESLIGETNRGLKILRAGCDGKRLRVTVEGLAGRSYMLGIVNDGLIESVSGASYRDGRLEINIPEGEDGVFIEHDVFIETK